MRNFGGFFQRFTRLKVGYSCGTIVNGGGVCLASGLVYAERSPVGEKPKQAIAFTDRPLTHQFLLKQASVLSVEAVSRVLTHTVIALQEENASYCEKLKDLIGIYEMGGDGLPLVMTSQQHYQQMVELKSQVTVDKKAVQELHLLFVYVQKLMDAAAETSFLVGADYASVQASERLHAGEREVEKEFREREQLEAELLRAEADHVIRTKVKREAKPTEDMPAKDSNIIKQKQKLKNIDKAVYEDDIKISTSYEKLVDKDETKYFFDEHGNDEIKISTKDENEEELKKTESDISEDEFNFPLDRKLFEENEEKYKLPTF